MEVKTQSEKVSKKSAWLTLSSASLCIGLSIVLSWQYSFIFSQQQPILKALTTVRFSDRTTESSEQLVAQNESTASGWTGPHALGRLIGGQ